MVSWWNFTTPLVCRTPAGRLRSWNPPLYTKNDACARHIFVLQLLAVITSFISDNKNFFFLSFTSFFPVIYTITLDSLPYVVHSKLYYLFRYTGVWFCSMAVLVFQITSNTHSPLCEIVCGPLIPLCAWNTMIIFIFFPPHFHIRTVHLDIKVFYSPTDAQANYLKKQF